MSVSATPNSTTMTAAPAIPARVSGAKRGPDGKRLKVVAFLSVISIAILGLIQDGLEMQ